MSDAMQVAHQNRKDYKKAIAEKEAEIAELQELIADLDSFIEFGNSLLGKAPQTSDATQTTISQGQRPTEASGQDWNSGAADDGIASVLAKRAG